jgi:hypothetical protein
MEEINLISTLTTQAPGMVAIIVVVILFLRSIERRDVLFIDQMNKITDRLAALETLITHHDANSRAAYSDRSDTLDRIEKKINQTLPAKKAKS